MSRSTLMGGRQEHRDRGRRKKHHRNSAIKPVDPSDAHAHHEQANLTLLRAWIEEHLPEPRLETVRDMSLKGFLQASPSVDLSPAEKLRQLAILTEDEAINPPQPAGWRVLRRLYNEAIRYGPDEISVRHSMWISMEACIPPDKANPAHQPMLTEALGWCREAVAVLPEQGSIHHCLGKALYEATETEDALASFERAIALEPDNAWAALFRAHCLEDLERWAEAAAAYAQVDISAFDGRRSWRGILLQDQLAHCLRLSGDTERAREHSERALVRYEKQPHLLEVQHYLDDVADAWPDLAPRIHAVLAAKGWT